MVAESGHHPSRTYVDQSGHLHLNGASLFDSAENDVSAIVSGTAGGFKIARGVAALDTANPTTIATGLSTVVAFAATLQRTTALTTGTAFVTHGTPSGGSVDVYAWLASGLASNGTESFSWVAVGT